MIDIEHQVDMIIQDFSYNYNDDGSNNEVTINSSWNWFYHQH
jgi:hypothetical protein